ncbi:hypothetical protein Gotur_013216, partial [Gossypium turneri]
GTITPIEQSIEFASKFSDQTLDKVQLQRFLGSLNYVIDFYPADPNAPKIVETDASEIGYGGILKQVKGESFFKNASKLRDKGKGKIEESSKTQITSKPIKSWYEICHEEDEKSSSSSKSSKNTKIQDAQDPN